MGANKRDPGIELYRICLMFGICLLHCVCQGKWRGIWPSQLLSFCVPGFVFVSGYFGIRFSFSKVIRLYSIPLYACIIAPLCGGVIGNGYWREVVRVWDADKGFWFVHAYVLLMVFAPALNVLFEKTYTREQIRIVLPILMAVMGVGVLRNYNHLQWIVPSPAGLQPGSVLTFIAIYCVARIVRIYKIGNSVPTMCLIGWCFALLIGLSFSMGYLCHINNPLCLALAILLFLLFKRVSPPNFISRIILWLSPFMFSVYCISGTIYFPFSKPEFFSVIEFAKEELFLRGLSVYASVFCTAVIAFLIGILFSMPQYLVSCMMHKRIQYFFMLMDASFERIVGRFLLFVQKQR